MTGSRQNRSDNKFGLALLAGVIVLSALVIFNIDFATKPEKSGPVVVSTESATTLRTPQPITPFKLISHSGTPYTDTSLKGQWTILAFGYTSCPDVCPTALTTLAQMDVLLKQEQVDFPYQVVFVSIDPERDNPKRLSGYVPYFNPAFLGVTGDIQEISKLTRQLGILHLRSEQQNGSNGYLMDHSANFILTNPEGQFHAVFTPPHNSQTLSKDLKAIVHAPN